MFWHTSDDSAPGAPRLSLGGEALHYPGDPDPSMGRAANSPRTKDHRG